MKLPIIDKEDIYFMRRALALAKRGAGKTSPNPMVGAIIVQKGQGQRLLRGERPLRVIGEGYHHGPGIPHAEAVALANASESVKGATLYTNLEPCCHTKKRTPPCTDAILKSGIARVVVGMKDPNPAVNGKGIQVLSDAGIVVQAGLLKDEAEVLNAGYIKWITTGRPFVILKAAMTLDGKIATKTGASRWITGEAARRQVHQLRSSVDAVVIGIGTVIADDPMLISNLKGRTNPLRVVIDPCLKISLSAKLITSCQIAKTLILTNDSASSRKQKQIEHLGVEVRRFPYRKEGIPFDGILKTLGEMGICNLLIEGGGNVNGRSLREGAVDRVIFYIAPKFLSGDDAKAVVSGKSISRLEAAIQIADMKISKVGGDICISGMVQKK
ncbi:MAG: bifunctional diaminohydroxyphosphoribosylaminopyrimidine deaminase/5-amino-6-(5-phosphoribosylamino)uracil reductase RibD [Nitrospirota bacterium]